jgi:hypothetical protein
MHQMEIWVGFLYNSMKIILNYQRVELVVILIITLVSVIFRVNL